MTYQGFACKTLAACPGLLDPTVEANDQRSRCWWRPKRSAGLAPNKRVRRMWNLGEDRRWDGVSKATPLRHACMLRAQRTDGEGHSQEQCTVARLKGEQLLQRGCPGRSVMSLPDGPRSAMLWNAVEGPV
jgi:hypothetical protein